MAQYNAIKATYPDAILLFRVGDFYETFDTDAVKTANVLGITLTKRANGSASHIDLAGFPHHALDTYLPKLVRAGFRVAICDQLEDPKLTKTIVKRGVTELVTPGVTDNDKILDHKANNFLAALHIAGERAGLALVDISTGEFFATEGPAQVIDKHLQQYRPSEVVFARGCRQAYASWCGERFYHYAMEDWVFQHDHAVDLLSRHFQTQSLKGFGLDGFALATTAAGAALQYLSDTQHHHLAHLSTLSRIDDDRFVWLDRFTARNLELVEPLHTGGRSLLSVLDHTATPMGARMMRRWLLMPLKDVRHIEVRHDAVDALLNTPGLYEQLVGLLKRVGDLERLVGRLPSGRTNPRELLQLKRSLVATLEAKQLLASQAPALRDSAEKLDPCNALVERLEAVLCEDAPAALQKGGVIRSGVNAELDELRSLSQNGKDFLLQIQRRESERTGIPSLKVSFNNVFGYYLEVTNAHKAKVPVEWTRKQTLVNAERYVTEELKMYEEKILRAEETIQAIELKLYNELLSYAAGFISAVQRNAAVLARLDCLASFAHCAAVYRYARPVLTDDNRVDIKGGRHPVIERLLPLGEQYVCNDALLDDATQQIMVITGPNMAGKSAFIRQVALVVLMAQVGSFVPADAATIGWVDKIFSRVGASDNLSSGESTFMVEMSETAAILNNLGPRSLVLLDEIGRGTATFDGISLAWSIAGYLHEHPKCKVKTLFATHYHELNELEAQYPRIKNYNVSIRATKNSVVFLRKLERGGSKHSFGIHVARMAGIPPSVLERATEVLKQMEQKTISTTRQPYPPQVQLSIFGPEDERGKKLRAQLDAVDINALTPVEALLKLHAMKTALEA